MDAFRKSWPDCLHDTITKKVIAMAVNRKHVKVGEVKVVDTETIYARAMGLQSGPRSLDDDSIMALELSPYTTSIFDADGQKLEAKTKADLHHDIIPDLLAAHGLTGCEIVATYFGIGKAASCGTRVLTYDVHDLTY